MTNAVGIIAHLQSHVTSNLSATESKSHVRAVNIAVPQRINPIPAPA
jgi:hypothetical protein